MKPLDLARQAKHRTFLARRDARAVARSLQDRRARRTTYREATRHLDLPPLPRSRGALWAVSMVRDEADVLPGTLHQLLAQGIDRILVVDNGSTDGTRDLLADLARADTRLLVGADRWAAYEQSAKMTLLADAAARAGAAWVVPFDADERWMAQQGTLAEALRAAHSPVLAAEMLNAFPDPRRPGSWRLDPAPHHDPKIAFRPFPGAVLATGNHAVGRPGLPQPDLGVLHLPWRSVEQLRRKVRQGADALARSGEPDEAGWHWRRLGAMSEEGLREVWESILRGEQVPENAWSPGPRTVPFTLHEPLTWEHVDAARTAVS